MVDTKLEVVVIPVSDVDRAKDLTTGASGGGRRRLPLRQRGPNRPVHAPRLGVLDTVRREDHGGAARVGPGSVPDRSRHRRRGAGLADRGQGQRGVPRGTPGAQLQPDETSGRVNGPAPVTAATARSSHSRTPTATAGCCKRSRRVAGSSRRPETTTSSAPPRTWPVRCRRAAAAHGEHEKRIGAADQNWPDWYAEFMVAEQAGAGLPS